MVAQPFLGDATLDIGRRPTEQELQPMFTQMKKKMSSIKQTIASLTFLSGEASESIELQVFSQYNMIITTCLAIVILPIGPHSQSKPTIPKLRMPKRTKPPIVRKKKSMPAMNIVDLTNEGP